MANPTNPNTGMDPTVAKLFQPVTQQKTYNPITGRGSLISFSYANWVHDPHPLVLVTDMPTLKYPDRMRGINLHYLTFNYFKSILKQHSENTNFSFRDIGRDRYIIDAFRSYKWSSVQQVKKLDCDFILTAMSLVRSFDPNEVEKIRKVVQEQITRQVNPTVNQLQKQQPPQQQQFAFNQPQAPTQMNLPFPE